MSSLNAEKLAQAKSLGFSDRQIAQLTGRTKYEVCASRKKFGLIPINHLAEDAPSISKPARDALFDLRPLCILRIKPFPLARTRHKLCRGPKIKFPLRPPREFCDCVQHMAKKEQHSPEENCEGFGFVGCHHQFLGTRQAVSHRLQLRDADELYRPAAVPALLRDGGQVRPGRLPAGNGPEAIKRRLPRPPDTL